MFHRIPADYLDFNVEAEKTIRRAIARRRKQQPGETACLLFAKMPECRQERTRMISNAGIGKDTTEPANEARSFAIS
jgi:hypothetical protein